MNIDSILHPAKFDEYISARIETTLEGWDVVRANFDLINLTLAKIVNVIVRRQNEIHARIVQSRPWGNCEYRIKKFDYLGDRFKIQIVQCRDVITGEIPVEIIEIPKSIVIGAHNPEVFEEYFNQIETNLKDKHVLDQENKRLLNAETLRANFEAARDFYLAYKDHFAKIEEEAQKKILPFEEWEAQNYNSAISEENKRAFESSHGMEVDLTAEIENIKKLEYSQYVQRITLGLE